MATQFKPRGYSSVSPYLLVAGAAQCIEFLVKVFDAEKLRIVPAAEGRLMHGEVRIDDTVIMLADPPPSYPPRESHVHIYVRDVDAVHARALVHGAANVQSPLKKQDPDRRGAFKDAGGTTWWVSTQIDP